MWNFVYFFYYLKITNWKRLWNDMRFVNNKFGVSKIKMLMEIFYFSLRLGSSFNEYFYYEFWKKKKSEIKEYATMGYMYAYQKKNNPPKERIILSNKLLFFREYPQFLGRKWLNLKETTDYEIDKFIENKQKVVLKGATGGGGKNVKIIDLSKTRGVKAIKEIALKYNFDILEEYVYQHDKLMNLAPNSLNTIRVITQYRSDGKVDILGTILRMGIDKNTDNLTSGGLACNVDPITGIINTDGISFDIDKVNSSVHPISGVKFIGFEIPMWAEVLEMCEKVAKAHPQNKSIGWDIAITNNGPLVIEGNHDWGARLWQMPVNRGMKYKLDRYC